MPELKESPFNFNQFHINEFSIKREPMKEGKPKFDIQPKGYINYKDKSFILNLDVRIEDSNEAYQINFSAVAYFKFNVEQDEDPQLGTFFYINVPAIAFPYIRSYVASVTALSGLSAIHLPLVNFPKKIGEDLKANTTSDRDKVEH
jgi:preprotein translocase subunit SecB